MNKNNYVAIMAGGIGSRFWPQSRVSYPKQFLDIMGTGKSLIQMTYERFLTLCPKENIYIVTNEQYAGLVKEQLPDLTDAQILKEPMRKNTAPCVAYVSAKVYAENRNARMVVAPSDHIILKEDVFIKDVETALNYTEKVDSLITLGIKPHNPSTGYGYIQFEEEEENGVHKVKTFTEKPTLKIAKQLIESGDFYWNAGIFIWKVEHILNSFQKHLPEMYDLFKKGFHVYNEKKEQEFIDEIYPQCQNISIDYGIMEKAENVYLIRSDFGWSDLGTWNSLYKELPKDDLGNSILGENVMVYDANNNMISAPKEKLVVIQGLEDFIIVDNDDVLLICERSQEQKVKEITGDVKRKLGNKYL